MIEKTSSRALWVPPPSPKEAATPTGSVCNLTTGTCSLHLRFQGVNVNGGWVFWIISFLNKKEQQTNIDISNVSFFEHNSIQDFAYKKNMEKKKHLKNRSIQKRSLNTFCRDVVLMDYPGRWPSKWSPQSRLLKKTNQLEFFWVHEDSKGWNLKEGVFWLPLKFDIPKRDGWEKCMDPASNLVSFWGGGLHVKFWNWCNSKSPTTTLKMAMLIHASRHLEISESSIRSNQGCTHYYLNGYHLTWCEYKCLWPDLAFNHAESCRKHL